MLAGALNLIQWEELSTSFVVRDFFVTCLLVLVALLHGVRSFSPFFFFSRYGSNTRSSLAKVSLTDKGITYNRCHQSTAISQIMDATDEAKNSGLKGLFHRTTQNSLIHNFHLQIELSNTSSLTFSSMMITRAKLPITVNTNSWLFLHINVEM